MTSIRIPSFHRLDESNPALVFELSTRTWDDGAPGSVYLGGVEVFTTTGLSTSSTEDATEELARRFAARLREVLMGPGR